MTKLLIVLVLCALTGLEAQAPVAKALLKAKTAYVFNASFKWPTAKEDIVAELIKWGRFKIVDKKDLSDVTITIGEHRAWEGYPLTVSDSTNGDKLWSASNKRFQNESLAAALVTRLREHLELKR